MDKTGSYFFFVWLLILLSFAHGSDVKIEVGPVEYGKSVTLKCILYPHFFPVQVTWTRLVSGRTSTVAMYAVDSGAEISEGYKDRLWMSTSGLNETAITINKAGIQDEGCYRCTFNYLPKGSTTGAACLTIPGEVLIEKHHIGRLLQPVTLRCMKRKPSADKEEVVQISWQKNDKNIATYKDGENIEPEYRGVISVTMEGSNVALLTLSRVNVSDEGKYKCLFNIFPGGSAAGETSLQVYEPLIVTVMKDHDTRCLRITCVARSWPRPVISWADADEGSLNGTNYDGFLTVTSWILIRSPDTQQMKMPKCKVIYLGEESIVRVSAGTQCQIHPLIIGLLVSNMIFLSF
ncbi:OX-2 membrane glycoprotein-like isoform X1 [Ranitomeya variabilis]|uniref:OX-2 membrane glycoprotein-like isoform X1 n=1 Tax=Ranitomeya variabilis TaxID=490064 RepID=UPI0040577A95